MNMIVEYVLCYSGAFFLGLITGLLCWVLSDFMAQTK